MTDSRVRLVIAFYDEEEHADAMMKTLKAERKTSWPGIQELAVVRRDEKKRIHIKELGDSSGGRGAAIGGTVGAVLGLVAGPAGVVVLGATGAWIGGLAAATTDTGIPNVTLDEIGLLLQPGTSAIVAIVDEATSSPLESYLLDSGAKVVNDSVHPDIAETLGLEPNNDHEVEADDQPQ